jgi:hypothetical protein
MKANKKVVAGIIELTLMSNLKPYLNGDGIDQRNTTNELIEFIDSFIVPISFLSFDKERKKSGKDIAESTLRMYQESSSKSYLRRGIKRLSMLVVGDNVYVEIFNGLRPLIESINEYADFELRENVILAQECSRNIKYSLRVGGLLQE